MNSSTAIVHVSIGAVAAAAIAAIAWQLVADRPAADPSTSAGPGQTAPPMAAADDSEPAPRPQIIERAGPGELSRRGAVLAAAGTPVADAEITAEFELGPGVDSLAPGAADAGGAVDADGTAAAGDPRGGLELSPVIVARSGADGTFRLRGLSAGRYRLRVEGADLFTSEVRFFDVPADGVTLVVARKVELRGTVVDASGAPAPDVEVGVAGQIPGLTVATARTDARGAFAIDDLQEGIFQVWAAAGAACS
ncbi:MAG: carboxypeptidase-like regulatory domain-containing protein, partial [Myxococcota bacterium]